MGIKKEIYYRFTFPDYENLTIYNDNDLNYVPESDNKDQKGEVRALCKACPERVITYDQLASASPIKMYADVWDNIDTRIQPYSREFIKDCVDAYLKIPKYFNLRNYEDGIVTQRLGMSLMVSDTPEVGGDYSNYTKFKVDGKTVYCAVTISSGDFFYSWCLPEEVIKKSDLRDEIVKSRFHSNWFSIDADNCKVTIPRAVHFNNSDIIFLKNGAITLEDDSNYSDYPYEDLLIFKQPTSYNTADYSEKRVFVQHYFKDFFQYGFSDTEEVIDTYTKFNEDLKRDFLDLEATRRILFYNNDTTKLKYGTQLIAIKSTSDIPILLDDYSLNAAVPDGIAQGGSWWSSEPYINKDNPALSRDAEITINVYDETTDTWKESKVFTRASWASNNCKVLRDMTKQLVTELRNNLSKIGKHTRVSYQPPDVYRTDKGGCPPLQIPYNLLRYCLNDRPPFTDCETVLVMWVADRDPSDVADGDVAALHDLNWQQYAIPISCRCRYKDGSNPKHCTERFLVEFPKYWDLKESDGNYIREQSRLAYKYHTRRSESFTDTSKFPEAMYLQDLINYSNNYMVVYQNSDYLTIGFDTQGYLLSNYPGAFKKLYCLKTYLNTKAIPNSNTNTAASNNQNGQFYYIRINQEDKNKNEVFTISGYKSGSARRICFRNTSDTATLVPSNYIYRLNINGVRWDPSGSTAPSTSVYILDTVRDWGFDDITYHEDYGYNDWKIDDNRFIALFDPDYTDENGSKVFSTLKNVTLSLDTSNGKGNELRQRLDNGNWDEFYISSFGVTRFNPISIDSIFRTGDGEYIKAYPVGVLDNFIKLNGIPYGSNTTRGVVVGFANMLDFHQEEDLYHFKWNSAEEYYEPIRRTVNYTSSSMTVTDSPATVNCTAYIMKYPK